MTLWESDESCGKISLSGLFSGNTEEKIFIDNKLALEEIAYLICRRGWPQAFLLDKNKALDFAKDYLDAIIKFDANRINGKIKSSAQIRALLRSFARHQEICASNSTIIRGFRQQLGSANKPANISGLY